jgi:hypothetical protein
MCCFSFRIALSFGLFWGRGTSTRARGGARPAGDADSGRNGAGQPRLIGGAAALVLEADGQDGENRASRRHEDDAL